MRQPTQYDLYRQQVLDAMVEESFEDGDGAMLWEGALTTLVDRVTEGTGHYQKIKVPLEDSGAIRQLRRGGGGGGSLFEIRRTQYMTDEDGKEILYNAPGSSPTRRNETQLLQFGRQMNEFEQQNEMIIQNLVALAKEVQTVVERIDKVVERMDKLDRGQTVSTEQDQETSGGDAASSEPAAEHGVRSLRVVEEGESLSRRLGLTSDPTFPGSA